MTIDAWRDAARQYGLKLEHGYPVRWSGSVGGASLAFDVFHGEAAPRVTLACPARPALVVLPADRALTLADALRTGDPTFDDAVFVADPDRTLTGALDADTRALLGALTAKGVIVAGGAIRMDPKDAAELEVREIGPHLERMARLGRVVAQDADALLDGVARLMESDPHLGVRAYVAQVFREDPHFHGMRVRLALRRLQSPSEGTLEALTAHLHDATLAPDVRGDVLDKLLAIFPPGLLRGTLADLPAELAERAALGVVAALGLRSEDAEGALGLLVELGRVPKGLAESAATRLCDVPARAGDPAVLSVLAALCEDPRPEVHWAAFKSIARLRIPGPAAFQALSPRAQQHGHACVPELVTAEPDLGGALLAELYAHLNPRFVPERVRYLSALGVTGQAEWTPLLVEGLDSPYPEVEAAAIEGLGQVGTLSTVAVLKKYTEGLFRAGATKALAREAIALIRERHHAVADLSGALALADHGQSGQLALADAADLEAPEGP